MTELYIITKWTVYELIYKNLFIVLWSGHNLVRFVVGGGGGEQRPWGAGVVIRMTGPGEPAVEGIKATTKTPYRT